jgi:signal transduction histidine kinase/sensor domain CHASE-containing protein
MTEDRTATAGVRVNGRVFTLFSGRALVRALIAFALVVAGVEYAARAELDDSVRKMRNHVLSEAGNVRARVESELNATLHLSTGLVVYLSSYGDRMDAAALWEMMARLYEHGRHFKNITVAPANTIRHVYPIQGNENVIGLNYRDLPSQWPTVEQAMQTRAPVVQTPVVLLQGDRALVYRNPVFRVDGRYWGMVSILIRIDDLLSASGLVSGGNVEYALVTDAGALFGGADLLSGEPVTLPVNLPSAKWTLLAQPAGGWTAPSATANRVRAVGFGLAFALALLTYALAFHRARRRNVENLAKRRDQHLRAAQKIAKLGSWEFDPATQTLHLSDEMRRIFQWSPDARVSYAEFLGRVHPDDVEAVKRFRRAPPAEPAPSGVAYRVALPDGTTRTVLEHCSAADNARTGKPILEGVVRDVTAEMESEAALRRASDDAEHARFELQKLIDQSPVPMLVSEGDDQRVVLLNQRFVEVLGYTQQDIPDVAYWWPLAYPDPEYRAQIADVWQRRIAQAMRDRTGIVPVEAVIRCKNGVDRSFIVHANSMGARNLVIFVDVTELRAVERQLREAKTKAEDASRAKSEFVANMSHEIRTPLNAVLGLARLLSYGPLDPTQAQYVGQIESSGKVLLRTINDILDFSKIEAGKLELEVSDFDLEDVLREVRAIVQIDARAKGLALAFEVAPELPHALRGDPFRLQQILLNLLGNAIKFTERGVIALAVTATEDKDVVRLHFEVRDTGIGISPRQLKSLFAAFAQADTSTTRRFGGSGLGLVICDRIARMMGGELKARGNPGGGSTFSFAARFHRALQPVRSADFKPVAVASDALIGWRLLLVEDNLANQLVATELLKQFGAIVEVANNGVEALDKLKLGFDAIIMDIQMPEMDGYEATRRIRALPRFAEIPIIAMTANVMADDVRACLCAGMNDHIAKPIDVPEMVRILRRWLDGHDSASAV